MVTVYVASNDGTTVVGIKDIEPICGDMCANCGECIVCAVEPVHASPWRIAHLHHLTLTEEQLNQRGLSLPEAKGQ